MALRLLVLSCSLACALVTRAVEPRPTVSLIMDPQPGAPVAYAVGKLTRALADGGWTVNRIANPDTATGYIVFISRAAIPEAVKSGRLPKTSDIDWPEALSVKKFSWHGRPALVLTGADDRGLMYAVLEAAERVTWSTAPADPFAALEDTTERPFIADRSLSVYTMNRAHWESRFYDEAYWTRYFDLLAASRFNRFLIIFGYENGGFLAPPYPYFFSTPGYDTVRMHDLTPDQQRRNLAALNRLIELAHERGIAVSLGIWDHIYRAGVQTGGVEWLERYKGRPVPNTVEGVTTTNLNAYTLASLTELLVRVPKLDGLQFRIHEESGLQREELDGFWRDVFTELRRRRPDLLIEARAKGTPDSVIATAVSLGIKLRIETKYWMEQMGLPFHPTHVNPPDQRNRRHGYADLLRYPQRYQMDWRLWNGGTQRVLLWGDPEYVRRFSLSAQLYDSPNWDVQEPLATKMEAQVPDMPAFDLMPSSHRYYDYEFERYWHFYQTWGRVGYNPGVSPRVWEHEFTRRFGAAGADVAAGLHRASQVLPMIVASVYPYRLFPTTRGWAERQSLGARLEDYARNEGTDTELFESFAEAAERIRRGEATAKRTPEMTSRWFDATAEAVLASVHAAERKVGAQRGKEFASTMTDLRILAQLARFHARRSIAAVHFNLYRAGNRSAELAAAIAGERQAVAAWRELVQAAGDTYTFDLAMGARNFDLCGHWRDELTKLEASLAELERSATAATDVTATADTWSPRTSGDLEGPQVEHQRLASVRVGAPVRIVAKVSDPAGVASVRVRYRPVTQFEDYQTVVLTPGREPGTYTGMIPRDAVQPEWDFMYFIEAIDEAGNGTHWPDPLREGPYVIARVQRP